MSQDISIDDREAEASARLVEVFDSSMIDALLADAAGLGQPIDGVDGLLNKMDEGGARTGVGGRDDPRAGICAG